MGVILGEFSKKRRVGNGMGEGKANVVAIAVMIVLIVAVLAAYFLLSPRGHSGEKTIFVHVIFDETTGNAFEIQTDAEYLRGALEEQDLIEGDESVLGLMVTSVAGRVADADAQEWWSFTKGGEFLNTGVSDTPIEDGDTFEITLMVGFDGW